MIKNYFKTGIRNILRHKSFSFINIFGLAVALSVCMLIILMLADQNSYDQYNRNRNRVYRLISLENAGDTPYATSPFSTGEKLLEDYGIFEEISTLRKGVGGDLVANQKTVEVRGYFADKSFFRVLDRQLIKGDENTALSEPGSVIISQEKAYTLFNSENPIGKIVKLEDRGLDIVGTGATGRSEDWGSFKVTGVIDNQSVKSHVKFDVLLSSSSLEMLINDQLILDYRQQWENFYSTYHYVLLNKENTKEDLDAALSEFSQRIYRNLENHENFRLISQPLTDITPGIMINNETTFKFPGFIYYIFSVLAFVIMLMACLNYTNLSIARSLKRLREIGVRKVNGAYRFDLFVQFLIESILSTILAMGLALVFIYFMKEAFMSLWINKYLEFDLTSSPIVFVYFSLFTIAIGIIAGIYPSLYLSKQKTIGALKNNYGKLKRKWGMQQVLSVAQFSVSLIFIVSALVIYSQFRHYINFEYGFTTENIINIPLQSNEPEVLSAEFKSIAGVSDVSFCEYIPAAGTSNVIGLRYPEDEKTFDQYLYLRASERFLPLLGLDLIAGHNLSKADENSDNRQILINEQALKKLGFENPHDAIGVTLDNSHSNSQLQITGVIKDFRASLLINGDEVRPLVIRNIPAAYSYVNVKISGDTPLQVIAEIENRWKKIDPVHEFQFEFMEDELAATNMAILDVVSIISYIAFLAIVIACLGLLGMAIYTTESKTREVGIRKVLGAKESKIVMLLSKDFIKLLALSILIAGPLSYLLNTLWLENLSHRTEFGAGTVAIGSLILLIPGILTIISQTMAAARKNPVESLKTE